jgi:peptidoglycan/xylan/chitin deacetylase (PgdA/CDA1 family)
LATVAAIGRWLSPGLHWSGVYRRRWRAAELRRSGIVLLYHRIGGPGGAAEPPGFGVERGLPVDVFEAQIRFMRRHFRAARAVELAEPAAIDGPAFAVSFDDGYADNLTLAAPVLERLGVPATLFVTTDWIGTERRFWWEQLGALLRETPESRLELEAVEPALRSRWEIPARLSLEGGAQRERAHWLISLALMRTPPAEIDAILARLADALRAPLRREGRDAPLLDWDGVRALARRGFDVGAHGRTHAHLGLAVDAAAEVRSSVERIAEELGSPPALFAYPYGGPEHRCEAAVRAIREAGCRAAFTTDLGAVRPGCDRWSLPRTGLTRAQGFACAYQLDLAFRAAP